MRQAECCEKRGLVDLTGFWQGEAAYRPVTVWRPLEAVAAALAILAVAIGVAQLKTAALMASGITGQHWQLLGALLASQITVVVIVGFAAKRGGRRATEVLALGPPRQGAGAYAQGFGLMVLAFGAFSVTTWLVAPEVVRRDLAMFIGLIRSEAWWLALLVIGLGAPLMEELLFRGFLYPALAMSRAGPAGAAVVTAAGWTALHAGYSVVGLAEVFAVGLYFAWLLWRTGSLRVPLFCHAAYNLAVVALLMSVDIAAPSPS